MNENHRMPPTPPVRTRASYRDKFILIVAMSIILMIGAGAIWLMAYNREETSRDVAHDLAKGWGGEVLIQGPVIDLSSGTTVGLPESVDIKASVNSQILRRNIYQAEVFKADVEISGKLLPVSAPADTTGTAEPLRFVIAINGGDLADDGELTIGGRKLKLEKGDNCLMATVGPEIAAATPYCARFKVRGGEDLRFKPSSNRNSMTISGNSSEPSFSGGSLPVERTVADNSFTATWQNFTCKSNDGYWRDETESNAIAPDVEDKLPEGYISPYCSGCGVKFVSGVDGYRKVVRAIKYAYLIILLTFVGVFATEILSRRHIPMLNYFLIGAALVVFYSLLLSIAEQLNFDWAYLISAVMTIGLICVYLRTMLHSRRLAIYNGIFLSIIYGTCYVMLCVSTLALLIGSLLIFMAIALAMYVSLKISPKEATPLQ